MMNTDRLAKARRSVAAEVSKDVAKVAAAGAVLKQMSRNAVDFGDRAQRRTRGELDRRRTRAAAQLESLAGALRPAHKARRRTLTIAGGSGLALAAALGAGVAIGMVLSRKLKERAEKRAAETPPADAPSMPQAMGESPVEAGLNL